MKASAKLFCGSPEEVTPKYRNTVLFVFDVKNYIPILICDTFRWELRMEKRIHLILYESMANL